MKAHGWHKLQQTFVCATSDCVTTFWCALDARGALQIARFQHQHQTWSERNISVHLSVDKKPQAWVRVSGGWCRLWNADFKAWAMQSGWMRVFGVLRSHKKCWTLKCAGREAEVRQIRREKAEFLKEIHPKRFQHHVWYTGDSFCVWANVIRERFVVFLIMLRWSPLSWWKRRQYALEKVNSAVVQVLGVLLLYRLMWFAYSKHLAWAETASGIWFCCHAFFAVTKYAPIFILFFCAKQIRA